MSYHVSIIIPFYKEYEFFSKLVKSLKLAVISSSNFNFELIIIIDSIDTDISSIESLLGDVFFNIENTSFTVVKNQHNLGVAKSRNIAIKLAKGEFIHIIDQDDEVDDGFYSDAFPLMKEHNFLLVNGMVNYPASSYRQHRLYYFKPKLSIIEIIKRDFIRSPGQVIFHNSLLPDKLFPEPQNYKGADDRFFWMRLFAEHEKIIKPYYIRKPNYIANIHGSNYSNDQLNLKKSELENWDIVSRDVLFEGYKDLIEMDILRIKYASGDRLTTKQWLSATRLTLDYFFQINKLVRFVLKRRKW